MKKRLFNIHKLIGINVLLFFFMSCFFGILTMFQPYISQWEEPKKHFQSINHEDIDFARCLKQVSKRKYKDENGEFMRNDFIKLFLPSKEFRSNNLIQVRNRPNFYLNPNTCKKVKPKTFSIARFFDAIHYGSIFKSLVARILFGFASVAVVFLCLSGLYLVIKNSYRNKKTHTVKGFFAKYHRLLLLYTLPLVFMFGLTGALFNLGVYSSPVMTNYLTKGETANVMQVDKNILVDKNLKLEEPTQKSKNLDLNTLYKKAQKELGNVIFYEMQIYNYKDMKEKVKFIGYEPQSFFISSVYNESYIVLQSKDGQVLSQKNAQDGSFTEKTLDAIFYLHYIRTFSDIPRVIFALICCAILFGITAGLLLWLKRAKEDSFSFKVLEPLSYTIILGSILSSAVLFASTWIIPKKFMYVTLLNTLYNVQEALFYLSFFLLFIFIKYQKSVYKATKKSLLFSGILFIVAVIAHGINGPVNILNTLSIGLKEIFFTDLILLLIGAVLVYISLKLSPTYFTHKVQK